ncbi:hypothetical protein [Halorarius halobius]|nr:hypothetical protein [Halorarius halobius]
MSNDDLEDPYCPNCDEATEVKETVPWQADLCKYCGGKVVDSPE